MGLLESFNHCLHIYIYKLFIVQYLHLIILDVVGINKNMYIFLKVPYLGTLFVLFINYIYINNDTYVLEGGITMVFGIILLVASGLLMLYEIVSLIIKIRKNQKMKKDKKVNKEV